MRRNRRSFLPLLAVLIRPTAGSSWRDSSTPPAPPNQGSPPPSQPDDQRNNEYSSADYGSADRRYAGSQENAAYSSSRPNSHVDGNRQQQYSMDQRQAPPPPQQEQGYGGFQPPGPSIGTTNQYRPIHYEFHQSHVHDDANQADSASTRKDEANDDGIPVTFASESDEDRRKRLLPATDSDDPEAISARRDAITNYMSTTRGRALLRLSCTTVGACLGMFVGKSLLNQPQFFAINCAILFFFLSFLRNSYGEWVKALGLALIFTLQRTRYVRRTYPTYGKIKSSIGLAPRQRFPPTANPWTYHPEDDRDMDFNMMYAVVAMAFVGSLCGGNFPLIPTSMGALAGGAGFAFVTTLPDARGDLARTMGMRVVALGKEVLDVNMQLQLLQKTATVSGKVLDKILVMDRKHRIKDRIVSGATFVFDQATRGANQQSDDRDGRNGERGDDRRDRPGDSRQADGYPTESDRGNRRRREDNRDSDRRPGDSTPREDERWRVEDKREPRRFEEDRRREGQNDQWRGEDKRNQSWRGEWREGREDRDRPPPR